ncbi:protein of unknown function [Hyphomicrobium sp. MC1]|nr:protein of unknown function [Hyphomicrobium sp. MC1]
MQFLQRRLIRRVFGGNQPRRLKWFGAIAQLGERLHGMQEVTGSIPVSSTNFSRVHGRHANLARNLAPHGFRLDEPIGRRRSQQSRAATEPLQSIIPSWPRRRPST